MFVQGYGANGQWQFHEILKNGHKKTLLNFRSVFYL